MNPARFASRTDLPFSRGGTRRVQRRFAYVVGFIILFVLSGLGNGSTYKMIPSIFEAKSKSLDADKATQAAWSRNMSGALIGFAGAVGALGGVFINLVLRASYTGAAKSATNAFWVFLAFYVICALVTWVVFLRQPSARSVHSTPAAGEPVSVKA